MIREIVRASMVEPAPNDDSPCGLRERLAASLSWDRVPDGLAKVACAVLATNGRAGTALAVDTVGAVVAGRMIRASDSGFGATAAGAATGAATVTGAGVFAGAVTAGGAIGSAAIGVIDGFAASTVGAADALPLVGRLCAAGSADAAGDGFSAAAGMMIGIGGASST